MTDLSPGTRHIVTEGVRALGPSQAARDRIRAGVAARIAVLPGTGGAGESGPAGGVNGATGGVASAIVKASLFAVIGAVVGGGFLWFAGDDDAPPPARPAVATASGPAAEPAPPDPTPAPTTEEDRPEADRPEADRPARPVAARVARKAPDRDAAAKTAASEGDDLAREVRLLDRARRALAGGDAGAARDALARYRREIAAPQMERESLLLRAEAQCAAAATGDGLRTLDEVDRRWPGASGVDAVRALCRGAGR